MNSWHVWSIHQQKFKKGKVAEFLTESEVVESFIYPVVEKEYVTKQGKRKKNVPVYNNYIFIKHSYSDEIAIKIQECEWIKRYIGRCSKSEIKEVMAMNGQVYEDVMPNEYGIKNGMTFKLNNGLDVTVMYVNGETITGHTDIFGQRHELTCNIDDIKK